MYSSGEMHLTGTGRRSSLRALGCATVCSSSTSIGTTSFRKQPTCLGVLCRDAWWVEVPAVHAHGWLKQQVTCNKSGSCRLCCCLRHAPQVCGGSHHPLFPGVRCTLHTHVHTNMCPHRRHELEVFMPPRSKILPQTMQDGYRNSQVHLGANRRF